MSDFELIHAAIGRLKKCTKNNIEMYPPEDWRMSYCGQQGLIAIYGNSDDMVIACFCPEGQRRHLETTKGYPVFFSSTSYDIITKNSIYTFDEVGVSEDESRSLCRTYEEIGVPKELTEAALLAAVEIEQTPTPHTLVLEGEER